MPDQKLARYYLAWAVNVLTIHYKLEESKVSQLIGVLARTEAGKPLRSFNGFHYTIFNGERDRIAEVCIAYYILDLMGRQPREVAAVVGENPDEAEKMTQTGAKELSKYAEFLFRNASAIAPPRMRDLITQSVFYLVSGIEHGLQFIYDNLDEKEGKGDGWRMIRGNDTKSNSYRKVLFTNADALQFSAELDAVTEKAEEIISGERLGSTAEPQKMVKRKSLTRPTATNKKLSHLNAELVKMKIATDELLALLKEMKKT